MGISAVRFLQCKSSMAKPRIAALACLRTLPMQPQSSFLEAGLAEGSAGGEQVAECMMRGLEQGAYHLPSPDFGQNLMVAASAGLSPHAYNGLLEFLLAPFVALALRIFGKIVDGAVLKHAAS